MLAYGYSSRTTGDVDGKGREGVRNFVIDRSLQTQDLSQPQYRRIDL